MAYDDTGVWNTVGAAVPIGISVLTIAALTALLKPTGNETQVQVIWNGQVCDFGVLRFLVS